MTHQQTLENRRKEIDLKVATDAPTKLPYQCRICGCVMIGENMRFVRENDKTGEGFAIHRICGFCLSKIVHAMIADKKIQDRLKLEAEIQTMRMVMEAVSNVVVAIITEDEPSEKERTEPLYN